MAARSQMSGFLPTIKCSNCNIEIEISMMGDHVCSQCMLSFIGGSSEDMLMVAAAQRPQARFDRFNNAYASLNDRANQAQSPFNKLGRAAPSRIDASGASK